jgi:hypothetical protein
MNSEPSTPHQPGPDDDATGDASIMKSRRQRSPEPSNNGLDDTALSHPVSGTTLQKSLKNQSFKPRSRADRRTTVSHTPVLDAGISPSDHSVSYSLDCRTQVSHRRPNGVWRRGAVYQYRVRVPQELNPLVGRTHINRSLGTTSITVARRLARGVAFGIEEQFEAARKTGIWLATRNVVHPGVSKAVDGRRHPSSERSPITIAELCERYLIDPTMQRSPKSAVVYRTTFRTIIEILGGDFPVSSISRDACRTVLKALQVLPGNARKRWPTLSINQILEEAKRTHVSAMSAANTNEYMNKLSSLLNWAVKEEILDKNPARGLRIAESLTAREKRQPFSIEQLRRIFDAPLYRGQVVASFLFTPFCFEWGLRRALNTLVAETNSGCSRNCLLILSEPIRGSSLNGFRAF